MGESKESSGGGMGCGGLIIVILFFWVACNGVTVNGKHYDAGCSCDEGVTMEPSR